MNAGARGSRSWGYVTLTVDRFGPRGIISTCTGGAPPATALDAYRALNFPGATAFRRSRPRRRDRLLARRMARAHIGRARHDRADVERKIPRGDRLLSALPRFKGQHDRADANPDRRTRRLDPGRRSAAIWPKAATITGSRAQKGLGVPIELVVYPGAYHGFDIPSLATPAKFLGHHLEFNQAAADQSIDAIGNSCMRRSAEKRNSP